MRYCDKLRSHLEKTAEDSAYQKSMDEALAREHGYSKGIGKTKEEVQKAIKDKKLTGAELSKYDARKLTGMQNLKALSHEFKPGSNWRPDRVVKKGWQNMGEGGGGYAAGSGIGRYIPIGAKSMTGMFGFSDAKKAVSRSDQEGKGRSRTERAGYAAGGALGGIAGALSAKTTSRLGGIKGMAANLGASLGGMALGYYAGGKAGKAVDAVASKARGVEAGDYTRTQRSRIMKKIKKLQGSRGN
ncbi:MAG: hypothetical protein CL678_06275 [Bdellovibrionaceae bacterium]|nr:hypothetical protein [Pseudobdellovibrionaceae bacterium]